MRRVAVIVAGGVLALGTGCTVVDPGESMFSAGFRNDLGYEVEVGLCSSYSCSGGTHFIDTIDVGETVRENISSDGYVQPFRIEDRHGHTLGCLPVYAFHHRKHLVVRLSLMTPCPGKDTRVA